MGELTSGQALEDGYHRSGRKRVEEKSAILILKTKEDKVLYVNKRTSV
jgi:hypothetical protein